MPKVARLRATFFDTFSAKMGHFLGHFLPNIPYRTLCKGYWRRGRDSNSWYGYPYGSLANCWFQPLTHLSGVLSVKLFRLCKGGLQRYEFFLNCKCFSRLGGRICGKWALWARVDADVARKMGEGDVFGDTSALGTKCRAFFPQMRQIG